MAQDHCIVAVDKRETAELVCRGILKNYPGRGPYITFQANQHLVFIEGTKRQATELVGFAQGILYATESK